VKFNDVSGEHGRNIGHKSHDYGLDVDTLQFAVVPGAVSGCDNFLRLRGLVLTATTSDDEDEVFLATSMVSDWILRQRSELQYHTGFSAIEKIISGLGEPAPKSSCSTSNNLGILDSDWLKRLITEGEISKPRSLVVGGLLPPSKKLVYRSDHNDHNHLDIADK
jgi:hypothetical protein